MTGESRFRRLHTSVIRKFKHLYCGDISLVNQEVHHSLVRSYLSLNVNNVLGFC